MKTKDIIINDECNVRRPANDTYEATLEMRVGDLGWHRNAASLTRPQAEALRAELDAFIQAKSAPAKHADVVSMEKEADGRWLASVSLVPGVMAYGASPDDARRAVTQLLVDTLLGEREAG